MPKHPQSPLAQAIIIANHVSPQNSLELQDLQNRKIDKPFILSTLILQALSLFLLQHKVAPKAFRTNNRGEYVPQELTAFLQDRENYSRASTSLFSEVPRSCRKIEPHNRGITQSYAQ